MSFYVLGKQAACMKLGLNLTFDTPQEAEAHARQRQAIGEGFGRAGQIAGGLGGGIAGGLTGGTPGAIAGGMVGSELARQIAAEPATLIADVAHDIPYRARKTYRGSMNRMNLASGLPSGGV